MDRPSIASFFLGTQAALQPITGTSCKTGWLKTLYSFAVYRRQDGIWSRPGTTVAIMFFITARADPEG